MIREAETFLSGFRWCLEVRELYVGLAFPGVVAVFLMRIIPSEDADEWLWVVVGDVPPAYLVLDDAPTSADALRGYIEQMDRWVAAVKVGDSTDGIIPVNTAPTSEAADALETRLRLLEVGVLGPRP
jgi:hypothetical protein